MVSCFIKVCDPRGQYGQPASKEIGTVFCYLIKMRHPSASPSSAGEEQVHMKRTLHKALNTRGQTWLEPV